MPVILTSRKNKRAINRCCPPLSPSGWAEFLNLSFAQAMYTGFGCCRSPLWSGFTVNIGEDYFLPECGSDGLMSLMVYFRDRITYSPGYPQITM